MVKLEIAELDGFHRTWLQNKRESYDESNESVKGVSTQVEKTMIYVLQ